MPFLEEIEMKTRLPAIVCGVVAAWAGALHGAPLPVTGFPDITFWAGSGTNSSAFVLQFGTAAAPTSITWGYRWNGSGSVADMIFSLAGDIAVTGGGPLPAGVDPRLAVDATYYEFGEATGYFLTAIRYDQVGLPPGWDQTTRAIVNAYFTNGTYPVLYSAPAAGGHWTADGEPPVMPFTYSLVGISDLGLAPGGWYGVVQGTGASSFGFTQPVSAVPEPSTLVLVAGGLATLAAVGRRRLARTHRG
jgi:hypothetical protein